MENKVPVTKRIEHYLARIEKLETDFKLFAEKEATARQELELALRREISAQREEILFLRNELCKTHQDKQKRNARALAKFRSE